MNINNKLKYTIYGLIFLVPFIPFIVINSFFFPFIVGKAFAFRFLVELMFGLWLILALRDEKYRLQWSWVNISATVFVAIMGLADVFGENPTKSIWSNFERMEGWITLIHLLGFLFVTSSVLKTKEIWHKLFNTSIIASFFMSFYALMQMAGKLNVHQSSTRLDATLGNSAYLAVYMLFHIFLVLFLLVKRKAWDLIAWLYSLVMVLQVVILYNTQTRGALLGFMGGLFLMALIIVIFEKEKIVFKKIALGGLVGIIVLVGLFLGFKDSSFVQNSEVLNRFADISLQEKTTKSRFMVWNMAWEGFKEKPILGWGQENFNYVFDKNYNPNMYDQEQWFDRTHNVFFDWMIAGGLLGLLGYLSLFLAIIYYLIKDSNSNFSVTEKSVIVGMLAGYFIHNFFVFDHLISYILFFLILGYLHSLSVIDERESFVVLDDQKKSMITVVIILLTLFSIHFVNTKGFLINTTLLKALIPQKAENIDVSLNYYKKALSYESFGMQEVREQLAQFASRVAKNQNVSLQTRQDLVNLAFAEMNNQIQEDPKSARGEYIFGSFLANTGMVDLSLKHLNKASELSPNKQSILVLIGNIKNVQGKYEEAVEYFKKAFELAPQFNRLRNEYASSLILVGDREGLEKLLVPVYGSVLVDDENIINAYLKTKQYENVIKILQEKVKNNLDDPQALLSLAAVYSEAGYKSKAIEAIEGVIILDPSFKNQGEYYIQEIKAGRQ